MRALFLLASVALLAPPLHAADAPPPVAVHVVRPKFGEITRFVTLPGTVRANQQATLYAKVTGYVTQVPVDKGQAVKQGDLLAELEVPEIAADLKRLQADAKVAQIELQRLNDAQKKAPDLILPQALDKARGTLDAANASIERNQTLLGFAKITAPFAGMVTMRYVDLGAFVPAASAGSSPQNAAVVTLMDFSTVRLQAYVPEVEVPNIREGEPVKASFEEMPKEVFAGTVSRFTYALDERTRTMLVEADLPNPKLILRPGMYATVRLGVEKHDHALLIPAGALVMEKTAAFVFKNTDGKAVKTAVTVGFKDADQVEIVGGVAEGDQVALAGKAPLVNGQAIQPIEGQ